MSKQELITLCFGQLAIWTEHAQQAETDMERAYCNAWADYFWQGCLKAELPTKTPEL